MLWKESKTYWKKLDRIWWDIVEMDASNINSDNSGKHIDGKSKRFTLFSVWNYWISLNFLTSLVYLKFPGNHFCWSLFFNKAAAESLTTLSKRNFISGVFL